MWRLNRVDKLIEKEYNRMMHLRMHECWNFNLDKATSNSAPTCNS